MRNFKNIIGILVIAFAMTACAMNNKNNKEKNEQLKEETNMGIVDLNKSDFLKKVYDYETNSKDWKFEGTKPAIVDFFATWCGPCKAMHPILEEISKEYSDKIDVYQIDVDKEEELAGAFGIRSIPTLLLIPMEGKPQILQGAMPKDQLKKAIDDFLLK